MGLVQKNRNLSMKFVGAIIDRPPAAVIMEVSRAVNDRPYILKRGNRP